MSSVAPADTNYTGACRTAHIFSGEVTILHQAGQVQHGLLNMLRNMTHYRDRPSAAHALHLQTLRDAHALGFAGYSALLVWANTANTPTADDIAKMMGDHGRDPELLDGGAAGSNKYGEGEKLAAAVLSKYPVTLFQIVHPEDGSVRRIVGFPNSMGALAAAAGKNVMHTVYFNVGAQDANGVVPIAEADPAPFAAFMGALAAHSGAAHAGCGITLAALYPLFKRLGKGTGILKLYLDLHPKLVVDAATDVLHIHEVDPAAAHAHAGAARPPVTLPALLAAHVNPASVRELKLFLNGEQFFLERFNFCARVVAPEAGPLCTFAVQLNGQTVSVQLYQRQPGQEGGLQLVLLEGHLLLASGPLEAHDKLLATAHGNATFITKKVTKTGNLSEAFKKHLSAWGMSEAAIAPLDAAAVGLTGLYRRFQAAKASADTTAVLHLFRSFITASNVLLVADLGGAFEVVRTKDALTNHAMCMDALYKAIMPQTLAFLARESSHFLDKPELDRLKAEADELDEEAAASGGGCGCGSGGCGGGSGGEEEEEEEEAASGAGGSGRASRKRSRGSGGADTPPPQSGGKKAKAKKAKKGKPTGAAATAAAAAAAAAGSADDASEQEDLECAGCDELHDQLEAVMKERDHFEARCSVLDAECKQLKAANNQLHMDLQAERQAREQAEARAEQHARFATRG